MKIWEAIQMLEQMDQTKECTVTFGKDVGPGSNTPPKHTKVISPAYYEQLNRSTVSIGGYGREFT